MTTVTIHPHGKLPETAKRLFVRLLGILHSLSALRPYCPEAHYMRGGNAAEVEKTAADDRAKQSDGGPSAQF